MEAVEFNIHSSILDIRRVHEAAVDIHYVITKLSIVIIIINIIVIIYINRFILLREKGIGQQSPSNIKIV